VYASRWSPGLRQGDILEDVFFPSLAAQVKMITTESSLTPTGTAAPAESVIVPGKRTFVAVLSHDCEFNEGKRNRLLLARIESIPGNLTEEQREDLRESNDVLRRSTTSDNVAGADSFVLAPLPSCFDAEQVIAFTTITPFPMKMKDAFCDAKRAELEHAVRVQLRGKVAWFFGRDAEDIPDAEKFDPPTTAESAAN
jgi:hypothetical protein